MTAEIKWLWRRLNANYWFYPALFAFLAAMLAFGCVYADRAGVSEWLNNSGWIIPSRPDSASNMLQVIAGSMIAVASTVFSITIVAVSYASGTYGPRLLTNFMEDKGNQLSLATFIGTFVYALTVLRTVRAENEATGNVVDAATTLPGFVPQLSLLVAYGLMAVSVAVLVFFLNHIPSGIRINKVIEGIGERLFHDIGETYREMGDDDDLDERPSGDPFLAQRAGYLQLIDFEELAKLARNMHCRIVLKVRTGDFVHQGMPIAEVCYRQCDEELAGAIRDCITLGFARTAEQDPQFLIDELVEIGLRALSPGINDPFTAVTALHWLGGAIADLGKRRLIKHVCSDDAEDCPVMPLPDDFAHYVERSFGAMRSAVSTSPIAAKIMLDVLRNAMATIASAERKHVLFVQGAKLHDQAREALAGPDLGEIEDRYGSFERAYRLA